MPLPLDELVAHPELVNQRAQTLDWEELLFEYELALDDIQAWLRGLNEEQIIKYVKWQERQDSGQAKLEL